MPDVPYPITAEIFVEIEGEKYSVDASYLKFQIYELIRKLYEEKIGGADLGDVFRATGETLTLELVDGHAIYKTTDNELGLKLDGDSLTQSASGLAVGQSGHLEDITSFTDISGDDTVDKTAVLSALGDLAGKLIEILDLLEEREIMSA